MTKPDLDSRLVTLETRMSGIDDTLRQLVADVRTKGHVPLAAILSAAALFGGALLWVVTTQTGPLAKELDRSAAILDKIANNIVSRADLNDKFTAVAERFQDKSDRRDDWQKTADVRIIELKQAQAKIQDELVTKREIEDRWKAIDNTLVANKAERERQLEAIRVSVDRLAAAGNAHAVDLAAAKATAAALADTAHRVLTDFTALRAETANKIDIAALNDRITVISTRQAAFTDKFMVPPK